MGIFSTLGAIGGKVLGSIGSKIKAVGSFAGDVAKRIGQYAPGIAEGVANIIGNNPIGNTIRSVGEKVGNFAKGTAVNIANGVQTVGKGVMNVGRELSSAAGRPNDSG